jgi:hypothetical protein
MNPRQKSETEMMPEDQYAGNPLQPVDPFDMLVHFSPSLHFL